MFEFDVLGPLTIRRDGQPIRLSAGLLQRMLFILLLSRGEPVQVDALADALWNGQPPRTAKKTMHVYIHRLRSALGGDLPIVHSIAGYALRIPSTALDAWRFEEMLTEAKAAANAGDRSKAWLLYVAAESLWRGEPYADADDLPRANTERQRLHDLRLRCFEARMNIGLELGRHHDLVSELRQAHVEHPFQEGLCALFMIALYRSGRRAEALEVYRDHYRLLGEELGMEPMPELRQLQDRVLKDDPALQLRPSGKAHRFLPSDIAGFVGRGDGLEWLDHRMVGSPGGPFIITAIDGVAGIGKTALAVRWAHRAAERFPDGQLYVNLRGYDDRQPLQPLEALTHLLRCLDVSAEQLPGEVETAAAMFRSVLSGRRTLLVLDNARSAEQIRPLLPGDPANFVLITSREKLSGLVASEGAQRLMLGLLGIDDCLALIRWMIGDERATREPEAVHMLVDACGRLPLALRIAATHLADRPEMSVASLVDQLTGGDRLAMLSLEDDPHRGLQAVLDQSYRALAPELQRAFAYLGIFPGAELSAELAAPLIDCGVDQALSFLDRLAAGHLIEQRSTGRYAMHDLVREYAAGAFSRSGLPQREPLIRLCGRLQDLATQAHSRIDYHALQAESDAPELPSAEAAMAWLEAEKGSLAATVSVAAGLGLSQEAEAIAKALWTFFYQAGHTADWIATFEAAYAAFAGQEESSAKYYVLNALGSGYVIAGQLENAMKAHRECIVARQALGDDDGEARSRSNLAMSFYRLGRYGEALAEYQSALNTYRRNGDRAMEAFLLGNGIPDTLLALGRDVEAVEAIKCALEILADGDSRFARSRILWSLGNAYIMMGQPQLAQGPLDEALDISRRIGNRRIEMLAISGLGEAHRDLGNHEIAIELLTQAKEDSYEMGLPAVYCENLRELGNAYLAAGLTDAARQIFEESLQVAAQHRLEPLMALALAGQGKTLRHIDPVEAKAKLRSALDILERSPRREIEQIRRELKELEAEENGTV